MYVYVYIYIYIYIYIYMYMYLSTCIKERRGRRCARWSRAGASHLAGVLLEPLVGALLMLGSHIYP